VGEASLWTSDRSGVASKSELRRQTDGQCVHMAWSPSGHWGLWAADL